MASSHRGRAVITFVWNSHRGLLLLAACLLASGIAAGEQPATPPKVEQVIVVYKTHFDIGYTDLAVKIVERYRTTFVDSALQVVDRNRDQPAEQQFAWTIPGWPMHKMLEDWPGQTAERRQRLRQALQEGRFVVHALPFTTHTELLEPEDLVRGLSYSTRIARELNLDLPRDAKMTDVPEHAALLATLLQHAGVKFMHIGCNGMSASPQVPSLYWWEGPDGSRVLTMYSPDYGTSLLPPPNWPHKTWLALLHTGDNHGPPRPDEIKQALGELAKRLPGVKVRIGRLADFGDAILAEQPDLPVVRGDMPDTWIHGPLSDPAGARLARTVRPLITATEILNTHLGCWGVTAPPVTPTVVAAYEQSLLYGEHTWGGSIGWLKGKFGFGEDFLKERASGRYQRIESSWDEHTAYIEKANSLIQPVLQSNLQALADHVGVKERHVVVFNPLPVKRSGLVEIRSELKTVRALQPAEGGEPIPVAQQGTQLRFVARDVPPCGYRTYVVADADATKSPFRCEEAQATLHGPFFDAVLDAEHGTVKSLVDKRTGRELVDAAATPGFGAYLYERFDAKQVNAYADAYIKRPGGWRLDFVKPGIPSVEQTPYRAASPRGFQITYETTPVALTAVMQSAKSADVPNAVTTRLTLYRELPYVDLEITLHDKPLDAWPEAGWLCLPLKVPTPQFRLGRLGNVIDPVKDILPGTNRHLFGLHTGVAVFDAAGAGVGICPLDSPLVSLDSPGCWKFSKDFVPRKPAVYVNLFNNQWNTNFRLWNGGTWTSRVRLWSFDRYDNCQGLIAPAWEARNGLLACESGESGGKLPPTKSGVSVSRPGIALTSFGPAADSTGRILRLWEMAGAAGDVEIVLPEQVNGGSLRLVNLRGEPTGKSVAVQAGTARVPLPGFAPLSIQIPAAQ